MRYLSCLVVLFLFSVPILVARPTVAPAADFQFVVHLFDYDAKQALDIHDKIIEEFGDGTLHDITYTSPKGGPVAAYLVVPKGKGPFAAVLFGHWGNGTLSCQADELVFSCSRLRWLPKTESQP